MEFFRACRGALGPGGILAVRVGVGDTYLAGAGGRLLAILAATLAQAFPEVMAVPGDEVLLVAGRDSGTVTADPAVLLARWRAQGVRDGDFDPRVLPLLVDQARAAPLREFLRAARAPVNTVRHPRAVLLAAALREARGAPPLLGVARALDRHAPAVLGVALAAAAALLLARGVAGAAFGIESGAVVGFASMGWWVLLLACWQETVGSVYGEIGALSAAFMAGTVAGAAGARRWLPAGPATLAGVLGAGAAVSAAIAAGVPLAFPRTVVVPLLVMGGALTGAAFPSVSRLAGGGAPRRGAGPRFRGRRGGGRRGRVARGPRGRCRRRGSRPAPSGSRRSRSRPPRHSSWRPRAGGARMAAEGRMDAQQKMARYGRVVEQLRTLLAATADPVARMATAAAVLHAKMPGFFWTGWYMLRDGALTVGPYQGVARVPGVEGPHRRLLGGGRSRRKRGRPRRARVCRAHRLRLAFALRDRRAAS